VPHPPASLLPEARSALTHYGRRWIARLADAEQNWVLPDSTPNPSGSAREDSRRRRADRLQDALIGPSAYDVVSLCQDARATVPPALSRTRDRYAALRSARDFDRDSFETAYAIWAQRATKIPVPFARLAAHGKPPYLRHIPRCREYLLRSLPIPR
jgi:aminoglycoside/choline kinase family phosphotransferase